MAPPAMRSPMLACENMATAKNGVAVGFRQCAEPFLGGLLRHHVKL
jgi:hypothetical protein